MKPGDDGCWRAIGVSGDTSCPELKTVVHCRNCPIYTAAGRRLIEREAPAGYVAEWTSFLAQAKVRQVARTLAVLVFRLGEEWLGLDAADIVEIAEVRPRHRIPHRPGPVLSGMVNIRGQLLLLVSLHGLLHIEHATASGRAVDRHVVIQRGDEAWVFHADEVQGVQRFAISDLAPVPVTVAHGAASLSRGLLPLGDKRVGYLDGASLFSTLRKAVG